MNRYYFVHKYNFSQLWLLYYPDAFIKKDAWMAEAHSECSTVQQRRERERRERCKSTWSGLKWRSSIQNKSCWTSFTRCFYNTEALTSSDRLLKTYSAYLKKIYRLFLFRMRHNSMNEQFHFTHFFQLFKFWGVKWQRWPLARRKQHCKTLNYNPPLTLHVNRVTSTGPTQLHQQ